MIAISSARTVAAGSVASNLDIGQSSRGSGEPADRRLKVLQRAIDNIRRSSRVSIKIGKNNPRNKY